MDVTKNKIILERLKNSWNSKTHKYSRCHVYLSQSHRQKIADLIAQGQVESASQFIRSLLDEYFLELEQQTKKVEKK